MSLTSQMAFEKTTDMDAGLQPLAEVYPERLPCRQSRGWHVDQ
jgi:error-prone DNA polymerase